MAQLNSLITSIINFINPVYRFVLQKLLSKLPGVNGSGPNSPAVSIRIILGKVAAVIFLHPLSL